MQMLDKESTVKRSISFTERSASLISWGGLFAIVMYVYFTGFGDRHYLACAPTQQSIRETKLDETPFFIRDRSGSWLTLIRINEKAYQLQAEIIRSDQMFNVYNPIRSLELPIDDMLVIREGFSYKSFLKSSMYDSVKAEEDEFGIDILNETSKLVIDKRTLVATEFLDKENSDQFLSAQCVGITEATFETLESFSYQRRLEERFYTFRKNLNSFIRDHEEDQREKFEAIRELENIVK